MPFAAALLWRQVAGTHRNLQTSQFTLGLACLAHYTPSTHNLPPQIIILSGTAIVQLSI